MTVVQSSSVNTDATRRRAQPGSRQIGIKTVLILIATVALAPYLFMVVTSFKTNQQFADSFWAVSFPLHFENYTVAWEQIQPYLFNTAVVAVISIVLILLIASISGFVLARYRFAGRGLIFGAVLVLMMVPGLANLIPLFIIMKDLGLLNTYIVLVVPYTVGGSVLGTILIRNFVEGIPQALFDAARLDGASGARMYWSVMLPLSLPVLGTISLLTVSEVWNDFFWPLLVISDDSLRTVSVGLQFFQGQNATDYGPLMAGYLIASLPLVLLFTFLSKYFLAGVQGGVPGAH
ncbi:carbohydrate ABC transporter permease [Microbacterium murale]|uniref:ABC-type glycerol-3-phosphate transport system permease component n=1 Tax=Microbacterium murale TaxID=1081040 RepID=A0ABU0P5Q0_9MICO|nr:carbohydrate ABC transporter permease [Microbacterium murale]MDQ0642649.1 ABC-type glycerol-3-phosphate transport system permease component [Microbacterium murale]